MRNTKFEIELIIETDAMIRPDSHTRAQMDEALREHLRERCGISTVVAIKDFRYREED
jgi:hypothetical protein